MKKILMLLVASFALALAGCSEESSEPAAAASSSAAQSESGDASAASAVPDDEVVVYSSRKEHLIKPLFEQFQKETGIKVTYVTDSEGPLIARLKSEGEKTPADMLITVDAGNLWFAKNEGVLRTIDSAVLNANIPESLRDPGNQWFGLSKRARTLVYNTDKVSADELVGYADLGDPKWMGRLCLRTSKKVYNQSLVAMMIERQGVQKTAEVITGWVGNLAVAPFSNDTKVIQAIAAGRCDVGIVNTYYFGRFQKENPETPLALFWADQSEGGVHVNVSGAGITRHAKHPRSAQRLLEWLSGETAQEQFAGLNLEYPVNPAVASVAQVAAWGEFKSDDINLSKAGEQQEIAIRLMDQVGYN